MEARQLCAFYARYWPELGQPINPVGHADD